MEQSEDSCAEILVRLGGVFKVVFAEHRVSEEQAEVILRDSCFALTSQRRKPSNPDGWLYRTVVEKCRRLIEEEAAFEDPPE